MLTPAEAKRIKDVPEWGLLEAHLKECVRLIDCVSDIDETEDHDKVSRGKKYAIRVIEAILSPFDIEELTDEDHRAEALEKIGMSPKKGDEN